jgi:hypothetical protein
LGLPKSAEDSGNPAFIGLIYGQIRKFAVLWVYNTIETFPLKKIAVHPSILLDPNPALGQDLSEPDRNSCVSGLMVDTLKEDYLGNLEKYPFGRR